jgi:hypothetical protein
MKILESGFVEMQTVVAAVAVVAAAAAAADVTVGGDK